MSNKKCTKEFTNTISLEKKQDLFNESMADYAREIRQESIRNGTCSDYDPARDDPYHDLTPEDYDLSDPNDDPIIMQLRLMKKDARKYDKIDVEELENIYRKSDLQQVLELEKKHPWLSLVEIDDEIRENMTKTKEEIEKERAERFKMIREGKRDFNNMLKVAFSKKI